MIGFYDYTVVLTYLSLVSAICGMGFSISVKRSVSGDPAEIGAQGIRFRRRHGLPEPDPHIREAFLSLSRICEHIRDDPTDKRTVSVPCGGQSRFLGVRSG